MWADGKDKASSPVTLVSDLSKAREGRQIEVVEWREEKRHKGKGRGG